MTLAGYGTVTTRFLRHKTRMLLIESFTLYTCPEENATVPLVTLCDSPLAGGPAEIHYREFGSGMPLVFLHGGWGYEIYPLDQPARALDDFRVLIPDRSGYGRSTKPAQFGPDLHRRATNETLLFLDALDIGRCILWGHSDGAVIAAMLGLIAPQRCIGLILEAFHYDREKVHSRTFFQTMVSQPDAFGTRVTDILKKEHGDPYWSQLLRSEGQAWLDIAEFASRNHLDLFDGGLSKLRVPTVFIHGAQDPRTESWELDAVRRELPHTEMHVIASGGHSPHSEPASANQFSLHLQDALMRWSTIARPAEFRVTPHP
jgi:pimeloyl-ACP methyl ester carboxylesterase